jgi:hypothetical protein
MVGRLLKMIACTRGNGEVRRRESVGVIRTSLLPKNATKRYSYDATRRLEYVNESP